jgi:hypothetical protein
MQTFIPRVINNVDPTGRNELAGRYRSFRPERSWSGFGRRRTLRDGLLLVVPALHRNGREQNQNRGSGEAKA